MTATVCHFSTVHSGVEIRIARKQLATLARAGFRCHLVIPADDRDVDEARTLGIELTPLPVPAGSGRVGRMVNLSREAMRLALATNADIYHFHDPELIPIGLLMKARGRRVIMDVHEDLANTILYKNWIQPKVRRLIAGRARATELFGASRFDAVVAAYFEGGRIFEKRARRIEVVHNYPLLSELDLQSINDDWQARRSVAYVGTISEIRGIYDLIAALPLANTRLGLAGKWVNQSQRAAAMALPGWSHVDEIGWVGRQEIQALLGLSFAGICTLHKVPNHLHSEPIKLFEYMAAGIPVVYSDIPLWKEFIGGRDCGICVDPTNPRQIAEAIVYLRDNPSDARRMGQNGRRAVIEEFNWDREGDKLVALYRSILQDR